MRLELPTIAAGKRSTLPRPTGSGDALLLARLGQALRTPVRPDGRFSPHRDLISSTCSRWAAWCATGDRFGRWPVRMAGMSRFRAAKGLMQALDGLESWLAAGGLNRRRPVRAPPASAAARPAPPRP